MEERLTTVLLADNHTMFREGLAALLTSYGGLEVVGETTNDDRAVALVRETKPDARAPEPQHALRICARNNLAFCVGVDT